MVWYPVAQVDEIEEGEAIQVQVGGESVALYNLGGTIHATHDTCTHANASLSEGYIDGDCVECPLHAGVFHIPSGKAMSGPVCAAVRVFRVRVEEQTILVETPSCQPVQPAIPPS
jgi:nitrite reductase/ring-hydroxylating ferredoxin subunit